MFHLNHIRLVLPLFFSVEPLFFTFLPCLNCIPKLPELIFPLILQQLVFKKNYGSIKFLDKHPDSMENNEKYYK